MGAVTQILARIAGGEWNAPTFIEMAYPNAKKEEEKTGGEIVEGLVARLLN